MGISGMLLVIFLTLHLAINLTSLISREAYESAWLFVKGHMWFQIFLSVLVLGFLLHIIYGMVVTIRNSKRLKTNLNDKNNTMNKTLFKSMVSLGVIVIGLLVLHLTQFWVKIELNGETPYNIAKTLFYNGFYVAIYVIWIIALFFHLSRGLWNMFESLNIENNKFISRLQIASKIFSVVISCGFILIPVYFYLGFGYV